MQTLGATAQLVSLDSASVIRCAVLKTHAANRSSPALDMNQMGQVILQRSIFALVNGRHVTKFQFQVEPLQSLD